MKKVNGIRCLAGIISMTMIAGLSGCASNKSTLGEGYSQDDYALVSDFKFTLFNGVKSTLSDKESQSVDKVYIRIKNMASSVEYTSNGTTEYSKYLGMNESVIFEEIERQLAFGNHVGLIVEPSDDTYDATYKMIDLIKRIINNYDIKLGIFYAPESIEKHDNNHDKSKINTTYLATMYTFLEMLTKNGIYTGLYVDKEYLEDLTEIVNARIYKGYLDHYDKIIVSDKGEDLSEAGIHYNVEIDGHIYSKIDMASIIYNAGLNTEERFKEDYKYEVQAGDTLSEIAEKYGIKAEDIAYYNGIDIEDTIYSGDELIIPSVALQEKKIQTELAKGIDVSKFNGTIDWEKVAPQVHFANLRALDTAIGKDGKPYYDEQFARNFKECKRLGIPINLYYVTNANSEEEVEKEVDLVMDFLDKNGVKNNDYNALYIDMEEDYINKHEDKAAWYADLASMAIRSYGVQPGCYIPGKFRPKFDYCECLKWIINHDEYDKVTDFSDFRHPYFTQDKELLDEIFGVIGVQYCEKGRIEGVDGFVCIDYGLPEYFTVSKEERREEDYRIKLTLDGYNGHKS